MRVVVLLLVCGGLLSLSCSPSKPTATAEQLQEQHRVETMAKLAGRWHRDRPIDYSRNPFNAKHFDMLEFRTMSDRERSFYQRDYREYNDRIRYPNRIDAEGFITTIDGATLNFLGAGLLGYYRIDGQTIQIEQVRPLEKLERTDWQIILLDQERLVVRDADGKETTFFKVEAAEYARQRALVPHKK